MPEEAEYLNRNLVDFAGMVLFYQKSRRNITIRQAHAIMAGLDENIKAVAVTVSPSLEEAAQIKAAGFDFIQIHGSIPEGFFDCCPLPVLKAFNVSDIADFDKYRDIDGITGYVFDAFSPGSGRTFDWKLLSSIPRDGKMFVLAGGISAANVREAVMNVHPDAVDVSSGVEYDDRPGKDPCRIEAFVKAARGEITL